MPKRDYYEVLEIARDADADAVKKAYRKLAMKYHPDRNKEDKSAEERFKEIGEAYAVLSDPQKRAQYDRFGHAGPQSQGFGGFGQGGEGIDPFELFRSVFSGMGGGFGDDIFGGRARGRSREPRGSDISIDLKLTLEEIAEGASKKVKLRRLERCATCKGSGSKGGRTDVCPRCKGAGEVREIAESFFGRVVNITTCSSCGGDGKVVKDPCDSCNGSGLVRGDTTLNINAPAGVSEGRYMRLRGEGNAGPHGSAGGDVIVVFHEITHDLFIRHGDDVLMEVEITFVQAALGAAVEVPVLGGSVRLTIPPGTPPGKLLRLRGKGIGHLEGSGRGDQIVRVTIKVPSKLAARERKLLEELQELGGDATEKTAFRRFSENLSF